MKKSHIETQGCYMMFDTHKHIKELQREGFTEYQAESIVGAIVKSKESDVHKLATQEQLSTVETKLTQEITIVRSEFKAEIDVLRSELKEGLAHSQSEILKWMIPFSVGTIVAIVSLAITVIVAIKFY